ncbi:MAG: alpha/beta family hydrolase [Hyphomicrobiales bacterium]
MTDFLETPAAGKPVATLVLAHGAGAPMDSAFMNRIADALAANDVAVLRFEFPYMAGRRNGGPKRPPPRAEALVENFAAAVAALDASARSARSSSAASRRRPRRCALCRQRPPR